MYNKTNNQNHYIFVFSLTKKEKKTTNYIFYVFNILYIHNYLALKMHILMENNIDNVVAHIKMSKSSSNRTKIKQKKSNLSMHKML